MTGPSSEFLPEYLRRRLTDIFITDYSHREESGGYENEFTSEVVVAKLDGKFVRVHTDLKVDFSPHGGRDLTVGSPIPISEDVYLQEIQGKVKIDTPTARQNAEAVLEAERVKVQAEEQLRKITPACPSHKLPLVHRVNAKKGTSFWGCRKYPECRHTQDFTAEHRRLSKLASTKVSS